MYRPQPTARDRVGTLAAVVGVHVALGFALVNLSGTVRDQLPAEVIDVFDVIDPAPPPPPPPPPPTIEQAPRPEPAKPEPDEGAAAPPNIVSRATPVVAPKPAIVLPIPPPIAVTETPNDGAQSTQGAAPVPGPGTGAGGIGTGTGSGSGGPGSGGGGGGGGGGSRPTVIQSTTLSSRDFHPSISRNWPRGGRVFVAVRVQLDGRGTDCKVNRSIGDPVIDRETCRLVEQKVRFRPAVDENGRPYVSWYGYIQADVGR